MVEHDLAKVGVASSSLVSRSNPSPTERGSFLKWGLIRPGGGTGRHAGLKILWIVISVRVQLPSRVQIFSPIPIISGWVLISVGSTPCQVTFMYFVYILQSVTTGRFYIGYSDAPDRRLAEHNSGKVKSTRPFRPWLKVYSEEYGSEIDAIRRERAIKRMKSRTYIQILIGKSHPD